MVINKNTKLDKILEIEGAEEILSKYEVPCLSCPHARYEMADLDLEYICSQYEIDCDKLIEDINNLTEK